MTYVTIARDPFARTETVREVVPSGTWKDGCDWCGQNARFHYGTAHDGGRLYIDRTRAFCSVGCWRTYHG